MSRLKSVLVRENNSLQEGYWIAGDEDNSYSESLLCLWLGRDLSVAQDCFNY